MAATDTKPTGRKADKLIRNALMAAARQDGDQLKRIAKAILNKAEQGDVQAFNALADRIDGKVAQPIAGDDENPLTVIQRIERVVLDPNNATDKDS